MRILLTNDDGISAPGIVALHDAISDLGEVVVVAPKTVQSATSHGITYHQPLMVSDVRVTRTMRGSAVDGRPADCVKLALTNLWPERFGEGQRPDLVISGMNAGANCGINVIYSGTPGARSRRSSPAARWTPTSASASTSPAPSGATPTRTPRGRSASAR